MAWKEERGDGIPIQRLFSQMLGASTEFIDTRVQCIGTRQKQDLAINPYFAQAVAMLVNAMEVVDEGGASQEIPVIARGASGIRTTATVNFHTGKAIDEEHVNKCHLNATVFDNDWERQAAEISAQRRGQVGAGNRTDKIRTYNFKENRVTDHRINLTLYKLDQVLAGDLGELTDALMADKRARQLEGEEDDDQ